MSNTTKKENALASSCSAVQISRGDLPDSLHVSVGIYTFYIQKFYVLDKALSEGERGGGTKNSKTERYD